MVSKNKSENEADHNRPAFIATEISWSTPDQRAVLDHISLSLHRNRVGLVGKNGCGKTTLIKILATELEPKSGDVKRYGNWAYLPQGFDTRAKATVAAAMHIEDRLRAISRIEQGDTDEKLYEIIGEQWDIEVRAQRTLETFGLVNIELSRPLNSLSGGQATRVMLAGLMLLEPDFLLLDEPTNHLDEQGRNTFYNFIESWKHGLLVTSHDRRLLQIMDSIIELTPLGPKTYGGNFDFYIEQKLLTEQNVKENLDRAKREFKSAKSDAQKASERQQHKSGQGQKSRAAGSQPKMVLNARKSQSEQTAGRISDSHHKKVTQAKEKVLNAKKQVVFGDPMSFSFDRDFLPTGKSVVVMEGVWFRYPQGDFVLRDLDLRIKGPERIALRGPNGSGKSTLVRMIQGDLKPTKGIMKVGVRQVVCLDQQVNMLDMERSIIENLRRYNPDIKETYARWLLGRMLFSGSNAFALVGDLSGGERLRAALCCLAAVKDPPRLLILDEPTNNLDLESMQSVSETLVQFQGAMIVISHDTEFLNDIRVTRHITLDSSGTITL